MSVDLETRPVTVEQRHRDAAADLSELIAGPSNGRDQIAECRAGRQDNTYLVQAFARFDTERNATLEREIAALRAELALLKEVIDASAWHRFEGEWFKRILVAETAIERIDNALGDQAMTTTDPTKLADELAAKIEEAEKTDTLSAWHSVRIANIGKLVFENRHEILAALRNPIPTPNRRGTDMTDDAEKGTGW